MKNKKQSNSTFAPERALRLRALRRYFRLSRDQLVSWCEGKVTKSTLRSWEIARFNGLTERGAHLIIEAFKRHNIICSIEWLLFGYGQNPLAGEQEQESKNGSKQYYELKQAYDDKSEHELTQDKAQKHGNEEKRCSENIHDNKETFGNEEKRGNEEMRKYKQKRNFEEDVLGLVQRYAEGNSQSDEKIAKELRFFCELNLNTVDTRVKDDALAPMFLEGDYVAGIRYFDLTSVQIIGCPCIVHTISGDVLVRVVKKGSQAGLYHLVSTNPETKSLNKILEDVKLISAAPILWIRRKGYL